MAQFETAVTDRRIETVRDNLNQIKGVVKSSPHRLTQVLALSALLSLTTAGCEDIGTELVSNVCNSAQLEIPQNGYQQLNLSEICNIPTQSFEAFRLEENNSLKLIGRAFDGEALSMLFQSDGTAGGTTEHQFTLRWIDPKGCNPGQSEIQNCRTNTTITVKHSAAKTAPEIQLIEIKDSDRTEGGDPKQRDFTAIVTGLEEVIWVHEATNGEVGIPQPALPTNHTTHLAHWGDEPIGVMTSDDQGVIGYANGTEQGNAKIEVSLDCQPSCTQQLDGSYQVSLIRGETLALAASAEGGVFGAYEGTLEKHRFLWSGLHNASDCANQQIDEVSHSGMIRLKVLDSAGNRGEAMLNLTVDGIMAPTVTIRATSEGRYVADGTTIEQGKALVLDAVMNTQAEAYGIDWYRIDSSQKRHPLGSGFTLQQQPEESTTYRAQLVSGTTVIGVADFQLRVSPIDQYATLNLQQTGTDRGLVTSESKLIHCGIEDSDDSANCRQTTPLGQWVTLNVDQLDIERFQRWEGCDQTEDNLGKNDRCLVKLHADRSIIAYFSERSDYQLSFNSLSLDGWVYAYDQQSETQYIDCRAEQDGDKGICTARIPVGSQVYLLTADQSADNRLMHWGGDCQPFNEFGFEVGFIMERDYACSVAYKVADSSQLSDGIADKPSQTDERLKIGQARTASVVEKRL